MKKQKSRRSTSTKYKSLNEFLIFIGVSAVTIFTVYITIPKDPGIFTVALFFALIIPTVIALVS